MLTRKLLLTNGKPTNDLIEPVSSKLLEYYSIEDGLETVCVSNRNKIFMRNKNSLTGLNEIRPPLKWILSKICWNISNNRFEPSALEYPVREVQRDGRPEAIPANRIRIDTFKIEPSMIYIKYLNFLIYPDTTRSSTFRFPMLRIDLSGYWNSLKLFREPSNWGGDTLNICKKKNSYSWGGIGQ